ncbi:MAG: hypothetical protein QXF45_07345 [Candidatus Caldarchaeum sp.]
MEWQRRVWLDSGLGTGAPRCVEGDGRHPDDIRMITDDVSHTLSFPGGHGDLWEPWGGMVSLRGHNTFL